MKRSDFIATIVELSGCNKKQVVKMLEALSQTAGQGLKNPGDTLTLAGIGKLKVVEREARQKVNKETSETIEIPAGLTIKFSPDEQLDSTLQKSDSIG